MFSPTSKQLAAVEKMEHFIGVRDGRVSFNSYDEFQEYFERLKQKANKKGKTIESIRDGKISHKELAEKSKKKTELRYSGEVALRAVAYAYMNRYFPSRNQLKMFLAKKTKNATLVSQVMRELEYKIDELLMIENMIKQLRLRWQNLNYITQKLYKKQFDGALIKQSLENLKSKGSALHEYSLEQKVVYYKNKGKDKYWVFRRFYERGADKAILNEVIERVYSLKS